MQANAITKALATARHEVIQFVRFSAETNPLGPGKGPWVGMPTGRFNAQGNPLYAFFVEGRPLSHSATLAQVDPKAAVGTQKFAFDPAVKALNTPTKSGNAMYSEETAALYRKEFERDIAGMVKADAKGNLPAWATSAGEAIIGNKPFANAVQQQVQGLILAHLNKLVPFQGANKATALEKFRVTSVGHQPAGGRTLTVSYDVSTKATDKFPGGKIPFTSTISDPAYVDVTRGGLLGFGSQLTPVQNVRVGALELQNARPELNAAQRNAVHFWAERRAE